MLAVFSAHDEVFFFNINMNVLYPSSLIALYVKKESARFIAGKGKSVKINCG